MNRALILGIAIFLAVVGIAMMNGSDTNNGPSRPLLWVPRRLPRLSRRLWMPWLSRLPSSSSSSPRLQRL